MNLHVRFLALAVVLPACSSSDGAPAPGAPSGFATQPGDLGGASAVIDHSGEGRGVLGTLQTGPIAGPSWTPSTCSGPVDLATGITDAAWSSEDYGGDTPAPRAVHASWRFDTATSLSVVWNTGPETRASWLAIGDSPDKLDRFVEGVSFTYATASFDSNAAPVRIHEAHVCGLTPGRTYYFAVGGDQYFGAVYAAKTAPGDDPAASFRIGVVGDSNNLVYDEFKVVSAKLRTEAPDWIAFTGDMIHDGAWQSQWDHWFAAAGDLMARAPTMTAHGNHEAMATGYFAQFALPGNEEYYSFDYGQAHFLVLNDSPSSDATWAAESAFAEQDLAAATSRAKPPVWLFAMHHRPAYCSAGTYPNVNANFVPIYDKYHVDIVLNGHEHLYESTQPIKAQTPVATPAEGTVYVTTGGGGGILNPDPFTPQSWTRTSVLAFNYVVVDVAGKKVSVRAMNEDGTKIEEWSVTKP